jgi:glycerophosphoryl diester phosphodiesterase
MQILSHRGFWKHHGEKNTRTAFERSFSHSFGTETDVRDHGGGLVISHDIPDDTALSLDDFLRLYGDYGHDDLPLALNIKADGLQRPLKKALIEHDISRYFVFDMAVPDMLEYLAEDFPVFSRVSEVECEPSFLDKAVGVWLDAFFGIWFSETTVEQYLLLNKRVCIVSPELHGRDHRRLWDAMSRWSSVSDPDLMICTDFPDQAASALLGR